MPKDLQYNFFTANEITPKGWLREQLLLQAKGLSGNLDKVWPDVRDSAWIGGDREGWERVPYWLDGFIPLAYLLRDEDMIARAKKYIDSILSLQNEDGWICPCAMHDRANYDTWAVLLILKVLSLYADCSNDGRIVPAMEKCLKQFDKHINFNTLRNWGAARWFEGLIPILWLYDKTKDEWLLTLAKKLRMQGFDWRRAIEDGIVDSCREGWDYYSHVVNLAMMLKSEALMSLVTGGDPDSFAELAFSYLTKNHGTAAGHFTGDENLSGTSPVQGTELCGVVEAMYSYEWLFAVTGKTKWLDRLERLSYNALPAAISPDMWSHQYVQMSNQVAAFPMAKQPFRTNNAFAHTFGLEPHFGCCTSNFGQGWPKFTLTSFMKTKDGFAACSIAPAELKTEISGVSVTCEAETGYPFRDRVTYKISAEKEVPFTFSIRIPACAKKASVNGETAEPGTFYKKEKVWGKEELVTLCLTFEPETVSRPNNMIAVWRGPLLYSVAIKEKWERVEYESGGVLRKFPYCDYYIYPESKWAYALAGGDFSLKEEAYEKGFGSEKPPVSLIADMAEIFWGFNNGHCDEAPQSSEPLSLPEKVRLVPYGYANLRLTEFPVVKNK